MKCEVNKSGKCNHYDCPVSVSDWELFKDCCDFKYEHEKPIATNDETKKAVKHG